VTKLGAGRAFLHTFAVTLWFYAMARIPIAEVSAMGYLTPIFVTLGAVVILGERLALRRGLGDCRGDFGRDGHLTARHS
jgi:drug/metabolite transporter (DMT)-like permease